MGRRKALIVTIVRHGETDANRQIPRIMVGQAEHPLNGVGIQQSHALGWRLKKQPIDCIFTSDLLRARQTAGEIAKYHPNAPIIEDERLREMNVGALTGLSWTKVKQICKKEDKHFEDLIPQKAGERPAKFRARVLNFYGALIARYLIESKHHLKEKQKQQGHQHIALASRFDLTSGPSASSALAAHVVAIPGQVMDSTHALSHGYTGAAARHSTTSMYAQGRHSDVEISRPSTTAVTLGRPNKHITPLNQIKNQHAAQSVGSLSSAENVTSSNPQLQQKNSSKSYHVLLVTHGGWIEELIKHLTQDLNFRLDREENFGFPKLGSLYRFTISKNQMKNGDYEWEGAIQQLNSVSHWAKVSRYPTKLTTQLPALVTDTNPRSSVTASSPSSSNTAEGSSPSRPGTSPSSFKMQPPGSPSLSKRKQSSDIRSPGSPIRVQMAKVLASVVKMKKTFARSPSFTNVNGPNSPASPSQLPSPVPPSVMRSQPFQETAAASPRMSRKTW